MIKQRSFLTYVLLSIITCGIYSIFFWYSYSDDMNKICKGDGKETQNYLLVFLLSFITFGIYGYIWYYSVGNRLQENAPRYGVTFNENGTTILLWMIIGAFLCGIGYFYALYLLVKNMNILGERYNNHFFSGQNEQQYQQQYQQPPYNN